jgi:hypothetical protein
MKVLLLLLIHPHPFSIIRIKWMDAGSFGKLLADVLSSAETAIKLGRPLFIDIPAPNVINLNKYTNGFE